MSFSAEKLTILETVIVFCRKIDTLGCPVLAKLRLEFTNRGGFAGVKQFVVVVDGLQEAQICVAGEYLSVTKKKSVANAWVHVPTLRPLTPLPWPHSWCACAAG